MPHLHFSKSSKLLFKNFLHELDKKFCEFAGIRSSFFKGASINENVLMKDAVAFQRDGAGAYLTSILFTT